MTENEPRPNETPLESWKEIAAYLKRDVRTVKRWEKSEHLPVHRQLHQARSSVYCFPSELDAWRAHRQPVAAATGALARFGLSWLPVRMVATGLLLLCALGLAGGHPARISAASGRQEGPITRPVWSGTDAELSGAI